MLSSKAANYIAPAIAARVLEFRNDGNLPPYVVVENLDAASSAAIKFQESDDGTTWADIPSTSASINPGESDGQRVTSARSRIALHAGGNLTLLVSVVRQVDGAPTNLGNA